MSELNGDALAIMTAVNDMHADLQKQIGNVQASVTGLAAGFSAKQEAVEARVTEIEDDAKFETRLSRVYQIGILPVIVGLHQLASKIGLIH